jgi:hypothetical protein
MIEEIARDWYDTKKKLKDEAFGESGNDLDYARQLLKDIREIEDKMYEHFENTE